MSSFEATLHNLPKPILDKLRAIISRVRRLLFVRGFCATLAVGLACLLVIMAIDATVMLFSSTARWALSLTGLAITLVTAWWFLIRPLSRKITLTHIARILEIRHPELQERISTAVELMSSEDPDSVRGSQELIEAVVDSAVLDVGKVDPKTEFKGARASRFGMVAGAVAVVLLLLFAIWPHQAGILIARAVAPFLDVGNAWSDTLEVQPGDVKIAIGETVTIEMTVKHDKLKRAEIRRTLPGGEESIERMTLIADGDDGTKRFAITFPAVADSFDYRVRAGAAVSQFYSVEAVPKPVVEKLTLRYDFPVYTMREAVEFESENGEIRTLANTDVKITAALNRPVTEAELMILGAPMEANPVMEGNLVSWQFPLAPGTESMWRINLKDGDGFENDSTDHPVTALPDLAPVVKITAPAFREMKLRSSEMLPIRYDVTEDIGLSEVTLLVTANGEPKPREIIQPSPETADGQSGTWHGMASLNLAALDLQPNQNRLTVQLRVRDNLPTELGGANEGFSEKLTIIIDQKAKSLAEQTLAAQKEEIREAIKEAEKELQQAKSEVQQAERQLAREEKVSTDTMRDLDEFRERANAAQEALREVAEKTENTAFRPQAEKLEQVANEQVAEAREAADMIPVTDQKDQRIAEAKEAQQQVDSALNELKEIEKSLGESDKDMRMVAELNELANDQRKLAQDAAKQARQDAERQAQLAQQQQQQQPNAEQNAQQQQQLTAEQMRQLAEFRKQQEQVQRELGEMLKESPEALRDILAQQQQQATQLAEKAEAIAKEQEQLKNMTEAAASQEAEKQESFKEQLMASLGQMQEQIAQETKNLQQKLEQQQPDAGKPLDSASEQTQQAADSLKQENMDSAKEAAKQATEALAQASQQAEALAQQPESAAATEPGENAEASPKSESPQMAQAENQAQDPVAAQPGEPQPQAADAPKPGEATTPQREMAQQNAETGQTPAEAQAQSKGETPTQAAAANDPTQPQQGDPAAPEMAQQSPPQEPGQSAEVQPGEAMAQTPPNQPSPLGTEPARQQLAELAKQQEMISQQLQAIEGGQLDDALAMMEDQVAQETQSLQQQAEALEQQTEAAKQMDAKGRADQAENALQNASQQASQASRKLAQAQEAQNNAQQQGQPANQPAQQTQQALNQSKGQQQQAQQGMEQAAQSLQQAADMLAQSLENMQATPEQQSDVLNPENLSEAFDDSSQSAQSQDSQQAAQNAQQAAESLQQLAQAAMEQMAGNGQQPPQPGQPNPQMQPEFVDGANPQLNETGMKTADLNGDGIPPELQALGLTAADWARLKGNLQSGGASQGGDDLPAEYRDLVGRYFQVIAKEAGKNK